MPGAHAGLLLLSIHSAEFNFSRRNGLAQGVGWIAGDRRLDPSTSGDPHELRLNGRSNSFDRRYARLHDPKIASVAACHHLGFTNFKYVATDCRTTMAGKT